MEPALALGSVAELIELGAARAAVLAEARPLGTEPVALSDAAGRVLAEEVVAAEDVPGFDNSAMDGYAVRASDTAVPPASLALAGESAAGHPWSGQVAAGQAVAISTGAALPAGADAVVRVEDTEGGEAAIRVNVPVEAGANVRRAGEDVLAGTTVIPAGATLGAAELGVAASVGLTGVICARRPRLHLLATGDELQEAGGALGPGRIRNSNGLTVATLARSAGAEVIANEIVADSRAATTEALSRALEGDVAVVCGGVSVGAHDHVKSSLAELGAREVFWRVALRPGKPTWFGVGPRGGLVFGLPGNPVSAMVTFSCFVRPAIRAMLGAAEVRRTVAAVLDSECARSERRTELARCRLELRDDGWHAIPATAQGSHVLSSMLGADGLAVIPPGAGAVRAGEVVEVELLD